MKGIDQCFIPVPTPVLQAHCRDGMVFCAVVWPGAEAARRFREAHASITQSRALYEVALARAPQDPRTPYETAREETE